LTKTKNNLIVINGGIGDVLLWTPALKALLEKPDVIFLYGTPEIKALKENDLVHYVFNVQSKIDLFVFMLRHLNAYNKIFLNHLCGGNFLLKMLTFCGDVLVTNSSHFEEHKKLKKIQAQKNIHDAAQNYYLVKNEMPRLSTSDFKLQINSSKKVEVPASFISVQLSAGNNKTAFKNWPVKHWQSFIDLLLEKYPDEKIVLLGDKNETGLSVGIKGKNIISLTGKTDLTGVFDVIARSKLFVGLDGGLMHMAAAAGKPTFTIWGGSSPSLYGYSALAPQMHETVQLNLGCGPCNSWIQPNTTKTKDPFLCPDFACLHTLSPQIAFEKFKSFKDKLAF
jgi:ADP-heptose:LPS heptosyltransferase